MAALDTPSALASGAREHARHDGNRKAGLVRAHEPEAPDGSAANASRFGDVPISQADTAATGRVRHARRPSDPGQPLRGGPHDLTKT